MCHFQCINSILYRSASHVSPDLCLHVPEARIIATCKYDTIMKGITDSCSSGLQEGRQ